MAPPAKKPKHSGKPGAGSKAAFYKGSAKNFLEVGHRGFLATTNFREKECVRECYNILNSYADELYGAEQLDFDESAAAEAETAPTSTSAVADSTTSKPADADEPSSTTDTTEEQQAKSDAEEEEEEDIATTLANQIQTAQAANATAATRRRQRFQHLNTGATNCVFIRTALRDPVRLAEHIMHEVRRTASSVTRNVLRFVPVEAVCKANVPDIKNAAGRLFDKHFLGQPATTYAVVYNRRCNNDVDRDEVIRELAQLVDGKGGEHRVDLKNARVAVLVEIVKGLCCLAVVPGYMQLRKYNLAELVAVRKEVETTKVEPPKTEETTPSAAAAVADVEATTAKEEQAAVPAE